MHAAPSARSALSRCLRQSASRVSSATTTAAGATTTTSQSFHTSSPKHAHRKPRFKNIKASEMGLTSNPNKLEKYAKRNFPEYTEEEKAVLRVRYTPEQYEALEAGEAAIDPREFAKQGRLRDDPYRFKYIEDFATAQPIIDKKPEQEVVHKDTQFLPENEWVDKYLERLADIADDKMKDTIGRAVARSLRKVKATNPEEIDFTDEELKDLELNPELRRKLLIEGEDDSSFKAMAEEADGTKDGKKPAMPKPADEWWRDLDKNFFQELENQLDGEDNPLMPNKLEFWKELDKTGGSSALAPELGKVPGVKGLYRNAAESDLEQDVDDPSGQWGATKQITGIKIRDLTSIPTKVVVQRFVANQTRLGKIQSSSIFCVAGNGDGRLGLGVAKSTDPEVAMMTAQMLAIRNMRPIRRYENRTIYGSVKAKVSGTVVEMSARPPGFGLRVSHRIFEMARLAGIHDLAAKIPRSKNPMNTVKAAFKALTNQPDPEQIAMGRGKKLVDVRKVYYGGSVH